MNDGIKKRIPVIIDTDPGVDDAFALLIAFKSKALDVRLVCSTAGNVNIDLTSANALYLTKTFGGDIPVARGSGSRTESCPGDASDVHGKSGIGNYTIPENDFEFISLSAVEAMRKELLSSDEKIVLITLGPLTNVAKLLTACPEVKEKIAGIYMMAGSVDGTGNVTDCAEFNAWCDPDAMKTVLDSGIKTVIAPLQTGPASAIEKIRLTENFADETTRKMFSDILSGYHCSKAEANFVSMYDSNAVEALIHPEIYEIIPCKTFVDTKDKPGQTFFKPDPGSNCSYIEIKDSALVTGTMLADLSAE